MRGAGAAGARGIRRIGEIRDPRLGLERARQHRRRDRSRSGPDPPKNPALQTHLGVSFLNAFNDQILYFAKATGDLQNVVLVAVNLDPRFPQECDIEVPLWFWGLPDTASVAVTDLMTDRDFTWTGKVQHIRLDPAVLPFAIWRVRPLAGGA